MGGIASCTMYNKYRTMIYVKYAVERKYVTMEEYKIEGEVGVGVASAGAGVSVRKTYDWDKIKADSPILPNGFLEQSVDCKHSKIIYLSIVGDDEKKICTALGKTDKNLIVMEDGQLR